MSFGSREHIKYEIVTTIFATYGRTAGIMCIAHVYQRSDCQSINNFNKCAHIEGNGICCDVRMLTQ